VRRGRDQEAALEAAVEGLAIPQHTDDGIAHRLVFSAGST
jgi:hypothetical protein